MSTDWTLVRAMMESAIDACEKLEANVTEADRELVVEIDGRTVSVFDILVSAWTYPESLRREIIRQRHDAGLDQPYVPETARVLVNAAQACAELIGAGKSPPGEEACRAMANWYGTHALPGIEKALNARRKAG
ncbi:MAG TPA: hypothetical protein VGO34_03285 [Alphaproteobacteria bacterium]|jgi:hypothetical protein